MPTPTRGRFVEFTPSDKNPVFLAYGKVPFVAQIVHVWNDKMVNLIVFYPNGDIKPETSVTMLDGNETEKELKQLERYGRFAKWPAHLTTVSEVKVGLSVDTEKLQKAIDKTKLAELAGLAGVAFKSE
ncbi:hypothetical protein IVB12_15935 [Bradyrhizobium sp. 179]|uniref:hypothetical protein n=1 Tax=Bradyrhizobium sp. 179 TaxID=2782648 RepID=UPI001FF87E67|nr:hypothetical protein [Bradyrhizobium sp. 179]MCK1543407.1 hypothetical protein [Bradyrhizobium sp. 179]